MVNEFSTILLFVVEIITELLVFVSLMPCKLESTKNKVIFFVTIGVLSVITCFGFTTFPNFYTLIVFVGMTIPGLIIMLWASKYKNMKFVLTYCLSDLCIGLLNLFGYLLGLWIFGRSSNLLVWLSRCLMMIVGSIIFSQFFKSKFRNALESINKGWGLLTVVAISCYLVMTIIPTYPIPIYDRLEYIPQVLILTIFLFIVVVLMIVLISDYVLAQQKKSEKEIIAAQLDSAHMQFRNITHDIDNTKIYRHDLKHHIYVLYDMCKNQKYDKLYKYLESMVNNVDKPLPIYCKNYIVNVILGYYSLKAQELGIEFNCKSDVPDDINIKDDQITSLLGNAISNALEECERIEAGKREIEVFASLKQNTLMLSVKNTCVNNYQIEKGPLVSKKGKGHGLGISSMRRIAEDNGGILSYKIEGNIFSLKVVIPV